MTYAYEGKKQQVEGATKRSKIMTACGMEVAWEQKNNPKQRKKNTTE